MDSKKSEKARSKTNGLGIASLVLAIVSIIFLLLPYFGIILAILAIVFSIIQKKRNPIGIATVGLVIGIIGVVLNLIMLIVVIGVIAYLFNVPDQKILGENVQLFRVVFNDKFSHNGYLNVPFLKDSTKYEFINIVVDFNKDGKFERYPIPNGYQEEWVVQNMAVKALKDQPNSFSILMPDQDIDGRQDFDVRVVLSKKTLEDWSSNKTGDAFHTLKIAEVQKEDAGKYYKPDPEGIRIGGLPDVFRGDVPDINQGFNECVPTSVTNSLLWLADHYGFADKIPNSGDIINELKKDLQWNQYGVDMVNYLPGIKKFAEDHNLPLQSYQVGQNYDANIVSKMAGELNKGNLVQMVMEYREYDNAGNPLRVGGHMVTVVGVSDTENGQYLYINDPLSQIPGVDVYKVEGNKVVSYRFQGNAQTFISAAVAAASTVPAVKPIDSSKAPQQLPQAETPALAQAVPISQPQPVSQTSPTVQKDVPETWSGSYSETGYIPGFESPEYSVPPCTLTNIGTLTWIVTLSGNSFSGTVEDHVTNIASTCEGGVGEGTAVFTGTVTGTIAIDKISGTMNTADATVGFVLPFSGTISENTITATYSGRDTLPEPPHTTYTGTFTLTKQS